MRKYRDTLNEKSRSEWETLIKEWIHDEDDRYMVIRHLLDGKTYERIAEEMDVSPRKVSGRCAAAEKRLFKKIS